MAVTLITAPQRPRPLYFGIGLAISFVSIAGFLLGLGLFIHADGYELVSSSASEGVSSTSSGGASSTPSLPAAEPVSVNSRISSSLVDGQERRLYRFVITQHTMVTLELHSDYDNYLELYDGSAITRIATDDDSGEGLNARLVSALGPGIYHVLVRPYSSGRGPFTLTILAPGEPSAPNPPAPQELFDLERR
jgi:hypothetical protein